MAQVMSLQVVFFPKLLYLAHKRRQFLAELGFETAAPFPMRIVQDCVLQFEKQLRRPVAEILPRRLVEFQAGSGADKALDEDA